MPILAYPFALSFPFLGILGRFVSEDVRGVSTVMLSRYCLEVDLYESGRLEQNKNVARFSESLLWPFNVIRL